MTTAAAITDLISCQAALRDAVAALETFDAHLDLVRDYPWLMARLGDASAVAEYFRHVAESIGEMNDGLAFGLQAAREGDSLEG